MQWDRCVDDFLSYLASEKGLSNHTVEAYGRDIRRFVTGFQGKVEESGIVSHLSSLKEKGYASSSIYRSLMALRVFFRFLKSEGVLKDDPTALLESPKMWQLVPEVLTSNEVERLLVAPGEGEEGVRDRAILETLYATGIRVSELCQLDIHDVGDQALRVLGKGGKERVVPIGEAAIEAIDRYLSEYRNDKGDHRPLFVTQKGKRLRREKVWERAKFMVG